MEAADHHTAGTKRRARTLGGWEADGIATLWSTQNKRLEAEAEQKIRTADGKRAGNLKDLGLRGAQVIQEFWRRSRRVADAPQRPDAVGAYRRALEESRRSRGKER